MQGTREGSATLVDYTEIGGPLPFEDARGFFEAARRAVHDLPSIQAQLERVEDEGPRSGSMGMHARTTAQADPIGARVVRKVDRAARLERRIAAYELIADAAGEVVWGSSWDGFAGICAVLGERYADVMDHYYVQGLAWSEVSTVMKLSPSRCRQLRNVALDCVDAYGIGRILEGLGIATDER